MTILGPGFPQLNPVIFANICQLGWRPLVITGFLKIWMQYHFNGSNIEDLNPLPTGATAPDNALTRAIWNANFQQSTITIESITQWHPETTETRPSLIIKRNPYKKVRLGVDDRMMFYLSPDGQNYYTSWMQGSHTIWCLHGEGAEAEKFASEVWRELNQFSSYVRNLLDLKRFEAQEIGELHIMKTDARENFAVPVTVGVVYEEAWQTVDESPAMTQLSQTIDLAAFQP